MMLVQDNQALCCMSLVIGCDIMLLRIESLPSI